MKPRFSEYFTVTFVKLFWSILLFLFRSTTLAVQSPLYDLFYYIINYYYFYSLFLDFFSFLCVFFFLRKSRDDQKYLRVCYCHIREIFLWFEFNSEHNKMEKAHHNLFHPFSNYSYYSVFRSASHVFIRWTTAIRMILSSANLSFAKVTIEEIQIWML